MSTIANLLIVFDVNKKNVIFFVNIKFVTYHCANSFAEL